MRSSQQLWIDPQFARSRSECVRVGLPFGIYHFYDDRASPGKQAEFVAGILAGQPQALEIFCDYERSYGGAYTGLPNVVSFMQRLEQLTGRQVDFYTGYWWFLENSNAVANESQYNYLKERKLWLAAYTDDNTNTGLQDVRIPKPWAKMNIWQYGTPAIGKSYGTVGSLEIDMNERLDGFILEPTQPTQENNMLYEMTTLSTNSSTRIRKDHTTYATTLASIPASTVVAGDELWEAPADGDEVRKGDKWLHVTHVKGVELAVKGWTAYIHKGVAICKDFKDLSVTLPPTPTPAPVITDRTITVRVSEAGWEDASVTVVQKAL